MYYKKSSRLPRKNLWLLQYAFTELLLEKFSFSFHMKQKQNVSYKCKKYSRLPRKNLETHILCFMRMAFFVVITVVFLPCNSFRIQNDFMIRGTRISKRLWSPSIDSKEWNPKANVAWRAGTKTSLLLGSWPPYTLDIPSCRSGPPG